MSRSESNREIELYAARAPSGRLQHCSMFRRVPESYCRTYNRILIKKQAPPLELVHLRCRVIEETPLEIDDLLLEDSGE